MAVKVGVRSIDSSAGHENEKPTGFAINEVLKRGFLKRKDFFISTNIYVGKFDEEEAREKLRISIENLGVEYLDLVTIHTLEEGNDANSKEDTFNIICSFLQNEHCNVVGLTFWLSAEMGITYNGRFPECKQRNQLDVHVFVPQGDDAEEHWKVRFPDPDFEETRRVFEETHTRLRELENNPPQGLRENGHRIVFRDRWYPVTNNVAKLKNYHGYSYEKRNKNECTSCSFKVIPFIISLEEFAQLEYYHIHTHNYIWQEKEASFAASRKSNEKRKPRGKVQASFSANLKAAVIKGVVFGIIFSILHVFLRFFFQK
ncbi:hypothetical protein CAEBREN_20645 [Caenorhabditis brenneri]|uniref:NADP-dependent oxidoreductase domain-containing protein n=1 Tax=Caenorhabditis brenneri TaxID=135651 RepID=G0N4Y4_CAEBE|nr:hypothetical protein CAEBREN_20645 [Caenorhabditis brenneri]